MSALSKLTYIQGFLSNFKPKEPELRQISLNYGVFDLTNFHDFDVDPNRIRPHLLSLMTIGFGGFIGKPIPTELFSRALANSLPSAESPGEKEHGFMNNIPSKSLT